MDADVVYAGRYEPLRHADLRQDYRTITASRATPPLSWEVLERGKDDE